MKFIPNPGVVAELEASVLYEEAVKARAEEALSTAQATAPEGPTGHYADSFTLTKRTRGWRLANTDFAAHWVEWGSIHQAPLAILRRAVQAAGLHLREAPKP